MEGKKEYIRIRNQDIPVIIRSYKTSRHLKMYFKADVLYVSKPRYVSVKKALEFVEANEEFVYKNYIKIHQSKDVSTKKWVDGEYFSYMGEKYGIKCSNNLENKININFDNINKNIYLSFPEKLSAEERKAYIDKGIKQILKNNTKCLLNEKVPHWSKVTGIQYKEFKVNDATSKFGSCTPSTRRLHFSSRLIMLPEDKIDAIVVHELCHIVHANHSKDFYGLVKQYIPNYDEINKWLKTNGKIIMF